MHPPEKTVVSARDVWKIFGKNAGQALDALKHSGKSKSDILMQYKAVVGVAGVSFDVYDGEILCIMGLSGSGKSTLLRHVNRLIEPTAGTILIGGRDIGKISPKELRQLRAEKISMVFQHTGLFPHWSIRDNVAFGLEVRKTRRSQRLAVAQEKLELVKLGHWAERSPLELSGGMQQRVGLARALATDPELILMDEPFSALDPLIRRQLQDEFLRLWKTMNKSALFITHDLDEAIRVGDRIAVMREGRFVQIGTPEEIVTQPKDDYVREFVQGISKLKFVRAHSIMTGVDEYLSRNDNRAEAPCGLQSVREDVDLDYLIDVKVKSANFDPLAVVDGEGRSIGVITVTDLLKGIRAGQERSA